MYFYRNSLQNLYLIKTAITFHLLSRRPFNYACLEIFFLHFYILVVNVILLIKLRKTIRPFLWLKFFYPPEDRGRIVFVLSVILSETFTLLITFEEWALELWYFTWVFLVTIPFSGYKHFEPVALTLEMGLLFDLVYNFSTVNATTLIIHIICYDKTFLLVPNFVTLNFDLFKKKHRS